MATRGLAVNRQTIGANLLFNGSFEFAPPFTAVTTSTGVWVDGTAAGSSSNSIYGWAFQSKVGSGSVSFDTANPHTGLYALKVSTTATASYAIASVGAVNGNTSTMIAVQPNTAYVATFWMKTTANSGSAISGAHMAINLWTAAGGYITTVNSTSVITTTAYTQYTMSFTTNGARFIEFEPQVVGNDGTATLVMDAWFDDITCVSTLTRQPAALSGINFGNSINGSAAVKLSNVSALQSLTAVTVEAWVYLNATTTGTTRIFDYFGGTNAGYSLLLFNKAIRCQIGNTTANGVVVATSNLTLNVWHKAEATWDGTNVRLFIDGVSQGTSALSGGTTGNSGLVPTIGQQSGGSGQTWQGTISELRISNVARHVASYTPETRPLTADGNTIGLYHLWEGHGAVANDESTTANNGTLSGTINPTWAPGYFVNGPSSRSLVGGNMIVNGDFEVAPATNVAQTAANKTDGTSAGSTTNTQFRWQLKTINAGSVSCIFDSANAHSGTYGFKVSTTAITSSVTCAVAGYNVNGVANIADSIPCLPSTSYTITFWMKTVANSGTSTSGAFMTLQQRNGAGTSGTATSTAVVNTTTGWTQYQLAVTTDSTTVFIQPQLVVAGNAGTGTLIMDAWFDDIVLLPTVNTVRALV